MVGGGGVFVWCGFVVCNRRRGGGPGGSGAWPPGAAAQGGTGRHGARRGGTGHYGHGGLEVISPRMWDAKSLGPQAVEQAADLCLYDFVR